MIKSKAYLVIEMVLYAITMFKLIVVFLVFSLSQFAADKTGASEKVYKSMTVTTTWAAIVAGSAFGAWMYYKSRQGQAAFKIDANVIAVVLGLGLVIAAPFIAS